MWETLATYFFRSMPFQEAFQEILQNIATAQLAMMMLFQDCTFSLGPSSTTIPISDKLIPIIHMSGSNSNVFKRLSPGIW